MAQQGFLALALVETLLIGAFFLLLPRIGRRGLLFGVYVGEATADGEEARRLRARWYVNMGAGLALTVGLILLIGRAVNPLAAFLIGPQITIFLFLGCYLLAFRRARRLASSGTPPAVAPLDRDPEVSLALPVAVTVFAALWGAFSLGDAVASYPRLPMQIPIHFGFYGEPDGWADRSLASVFLLPVMALIMGVGLGGAACLTTRAKRALRGGAVEVSAQAQRRFRLAMTRFMSGVALFTVVLLNLIAYFSLRVGLGQAERIPSGVMVLAGGLLLYAMVGSLTLALRHGQGGSRHEAATGTLPPLTDGLADNRCWRLGLFYVNREDPSFLVEHRFGLGYTLNFGNPAAVAVLATFLALVLGSVAAALALF